LEIPKSVLHFTLVQPSVTHWYMVIMEGILATHGSLCCARIPLADRVRKCRE